MPNDPNAPADTAMMRIVHTAIRRDLARAQAALTRVPPPDDRQHCAIAHQLDWMMHFLEAHHRSEDLGLYPVVRERDPGAAALLDDMQRDHVVVATAIAEVEAAAASNAGVDRERLVRALDDLTTVLLPHLQREEDEAMPVVSRVITNAEWSAIDQQHNLDGKSMAQLGREGHWLIDDATTEDRATVLGLVPPVPRLLLLYGFGRSYRRQKRACWDPRRRRVQKQGATAVVVEADMDTVWDVVRDPTRVGEWSHECVDGQWMGDVAEARPGARFRGRNKQGMFRWGRLCEVVSVERYELVWRTVPTVFYPDSTVWALRLERTNGGTRIEQTFQAVKVPPKVLEVIYAFMVPGHRDRTDALIQDLLRLGTVAARAQTESLPA